MRTGLVLIILLGFGYLAPLSCSKKHKPSKMRQCIGQPTGKQMVLFAPMLILRKHIG